MRPPRSRLALLAIPFAILVIVAAVTLLVGGLRSVEAILPGSQVLKGESRLVELEGGDYTLFLIGNKTSDSANNTVRRFPSEVEIKKPGQRALSLAQYTSDFSVVHGGRSAYAFKTFQVSSGGVYRISVTGTAHSAAVGRSGEAPKEIGIIIASVMLGVLGLLSCAAFFFWAQGRARQRST